MSIASRAAAVAVTRCPASRSVAAGASRASASSRSTEINIRGPAFSGMYRSGCDARPVIERPAGPAPAAHDALGGPPATPPPPPAQQATHGCRRRPGYLLLLSLVLLAPELRRLAQFFSGRAVGPSTQPRLFRTRRANRIALAAQVALGLSILTASLHLSWVEWDTVGGGAEKPPLYGIWNVVEFSVTVRTSHPC